MVDLMADTLAASMVGQMVDASVELLAVDWAGYLDAS